MYKIILPALLCTLTLNASEKGAIETINRINQYTNDMSTAPTDPACGYKCMLEPLVKNCATEICSTSRIKKTYHELQKDALDSVAQTLKDPKVKAAANKIEELIKKTIQYDIQSKLDSLESVSSFKKDNKFPHESNVALGFLFDVINYEEGKYKNLPPHLEQMAKKTSETFTSIVTAYADRYAFEGTQAYLSYYYPNLDTHQALEKEISKFESIKKKVLASEEFKAFPTIKDSINDFYNSQLYSDHKAKRDFNISDADDFIAQNAIMDVVISFVNHSEFKKLKSELNASEVRKLVYSDRMASAGEALKKDLLSFKANPALLDPYISECTNKFIAAYSQLPTTETKNSLNGITQSLKANLDTKVLAKFSEESRKKLGSRLKDIKFWTQSRDELLHKTQYEIKEDLENDLRLDKLPDPENEKLMQMIDLPLASYNESDAGNKQYLRNELFDLDSVCDDLFPSPVTDGSYSALGAITVGWGSLKDIHAGKGVMAHELGHQLKAFIEKGISGHSQEKYNAISQCLNSRHSSNKYHGEDFADFISATLEGPTGNNIGCYMLENEIGDLRATEDAPHSSDLFRLLHIEQTMKGSIPKSCETYLERMNASSSLFSSCWNPKPITVRY